MMRVEFLPTARNVVGFPVERRERPTVDLLHRVAPAFYEVDYVAELYGLDMPLDDLREQVGCETAGLIDAWTVEGTARRQALLGLLEPPVQQAVDACAAARAAAAQAEAAFGKLGEARAEGGYWLAPLEGRADSRLQLAAELFVAAHASCERAFGVHRAVGLALRNQPWTAFDASVAMNELCAEEARRRA